jgi:hypothetical protein
MINDLGIQNPAYLFGREDGNVVFIDESSLLLNKFRFRFFFEIFTGQPEQYILFTILTL